MIIKNENLIYNIIERIKTKKVYKDIINQFHSEILDRISLIDECIIYNPEDIKEESINWEYVLKTEKDLTGFEASSNEIRLGDYLNIEKAEFIELTYIIVDELAIYLKNQYPNRIFEIVAQVNMNMNDNVLLRFYQKRKNEEWIDFNNLDNYGENLLVRIC